MEYTLRKLKADDMFLMFGILSKIGFRELKDCFGSDEAKEAIKQAMASGGEDDGESKRQFETVGVAVALDMADVVLRNLPKCKAEIYALLSALSGMTAAEIVELDMSTFAGMIVDVMRKDEFPDFFTAVKRLFKRAT